MIKSSASKFVLSCAVAFGFTSLCISAQAASLFSEDFSDNSAGWALGTEWQIGSATASSPSGIVGFPDPATDHTPTADNGVAGVVIGGNATTNLHDFYYLVSPIINLSSTVGTTTFEYYRWLNSDYGPFYPSTLDVFNGTSWMNLFTTATPGVFDNSWKLQTFNISGYVNSAFQVRYGTKIGAFGTYTVSSWNIDDISISDQSIVSEVPLPAALPLFAAGVSAMGFVGWRRKRRAA